MRSQWPECTCDLCLILHSCEQRGEKLEHPASSVEVRETIFVGVKPVEDSIDGGPPPYTDDDQIDYEEYCSDYPPFVILPY
jgi:hypothetical protein